MIDSRQSSLTTVRGRLGDSRPLFGVTREPVPLADHRRVLYLSKRETEILQLVATGGSNIEVAASLGISQQTVKNHLSSIFSKLRVRGRVAAVTQAVKQGLVTVR